MSDYLDVPLEDPAIMEEVELVSNLMIAAGESPRSLNADEIDLLLGILPKRRRGIPSEPGDVGAG